MAKFIGTGISPQVINRDIGTSREETAFKSNLKEFEKLSNSEDRKDLFGNTVPLKDTFRGLGRELKDTSFTVETFRKVSRQKEKLLNTEKYTYDDFKEDNAFSENFKRDYQFREANNLSRETILNIQGNYEERRENEQIQDRLNFTQKALRFITSIPASIVSDPVMTTVDLGLGAVTGGVGFVVSNVGRYALKQAGIGVVTDAAFQVYQGDSLEQEGERPLTLTERVGQATFSGITAGAIGGGGALIKKKYNAYKEKKEKNNDDINFEKFKKQKEAELEIFNELNQVLTKTDKMDTAIDTTKASNTMSNFFQGNVNEIAKIENSISKYLKSNNYIFKDQLKSLETNINIPKISEAPIYYNYKIVEIDDLINAYNIDGTANNNHINPNTLSKKSSQTVKDITLNTDLSQYIGSNLSDGTPIISLKNQIITGNKKSLALNLLYNGDLSSENFKLNLKKAFLQFNIDSFDKPIIVRQLKENFDNKFLKQLATASNSPVNKIKKSNILETFNDNEFAEVITTNNNQTNVALQNISKRILDIKDNYPNYDISNAIKKAYSLKNFTEDNPNFLKQALKNKNFFGYELDPTTVSIAKSFFVDENTLNKFDSTENIEKFFNSYFKKVKSNKDNLSIEELLEASKKETKVNYTPTKKTTQNAAETEPVIENQNTVETNNVNEVDKNFLDTEPKTLQELQNTKDLENLSEANKKELKEIESELKEDLKEYDDYINCLTK